MWFVSFRLEAGIFYFASFRSQFSTVQLFRSLMHPNPVPGPRKKLRKCTSFGTLPFAVWFVPYRGPIAIPGVSLCSQASIREPCRLVWHPGWLGHGRACMRSEGKNLCTLTTHILRPTVEQIAPGRAMHFPSYHRVPGRGLSFGRELSVAKNFGWGDVLWSKVTSL